MTKYIIRRVLQFIPVLFVVVLFTFVLMRAIPGGPFDNAGDRALPPQVVANIEAKYHLDWPMWKQFLSYLIGDDLLGETGTSKGVIRGDLGPSLRYRGQSVNDIIATTFPTSLQLGVLALLVSVIIGIPTGIIAALNQNYLDRLRQHLLVRDLPLCAEYCAGPRADLAICFETGLVPGRHLGGQAAVPAWAFCPGWIN